MTTVARPIPTGAILILFLAAHSASQPAAPEVSDLTSPRQGPTWVVLRWFSDFDRHDISYRPYGSGGRTRRPWQTIGDVHGYEYSVINLVPDTLYEFRVRVHGHASPTSGPGGAALIVRTAPAIRHWLGLSLSPEVPVGPHPESPADFALESHDGQLYLLEADGTTLTLHCINPGTFAILWSRPIALNITEPPVPCFAPDLCSFRGRLWATWHVRLRGPSPDTWVTRQRLVVLDPAAEPSNWVSAPFQVYPSAASRSTGFGSLASYQDRLWLCWLEYWMGENGVEQARLIVGAYDPRRGQLADVTAWVDGCPTPCPGPPGIARFGSDLVVLFSDRELAAKGTEPLFAARFDGKRFSDVRRLRALGRNFAPRGAQLGDLFYYVYQSDAYYPDGAGAYYDVMLGRLSGSTAPDIASELNFAGYRLVSDMKHNSRPDCAAVGDTLFVVYSKRDPPNDLASGGPVVQRVFGAWLTKVSPPPVEPPS